MRGRIGTSMSAAQKPLRPKKWTSKELTQVKLLLKKGFSNVTISNNLKSKTPRDVEELLSNEGILR